MHDKSQTDAAAIQPWDRRVERDTRLFAKQFFLLLLVSLLVVGLALIAHEYAERGVERDALMAQEATQVAVGKRHLTRALETVSADLKFLAASEPMRSVLDETDPKQRARLARSFANLATHRRLYDQIRYLDETGMEVVRVDFNEGDVLVVPEERLQDKSGRYYFADTFELQRGQVYVSPLDLNIEHGRIQQPLNPMLRVGTPVFDTQGRKRGIVLLNYLGRVLIRSLQEVTRGSWGIPLFLNRDGYWFLGADRSQEWGFMFNNGRTFGSVFPEAWAAVSGSAQGQIWTHDGLFSFDTIYPLSEAQTSSSGAAEAHASSTRRVDAKGYAWKVLTHVDPKAAAHAVGGYMEHGFQMLMLLSLILLPASWLLARAWARSRAAEIAVRASEERCRSLYDDNPSIFITTDTAGKVLSVNRYGARELGYAANDLLERPLLELVAEEDRAAALECLAACVDMPDRSQAWEYRMVDRRGASIWVRTTARAVRDQSGDQVVLTVTEDISVRKQAEAERESLQKQLLELMREAGMAEVASGVLHNVGNVLNSLNVSTTLVAEKLQGLRLSGLEQAACLLRDHAETLPDFLAKDPKGQQLPDYLSVLSQHLSDGRDAMAKELARLREDTQHIKEIVTAQQSYAAHHDVSEPVSVAEIVEDAVRMNISSRHQIEFVREYEELPLILVDRHRLLQILVNLVRNAKQALNARREARKRITLRVGPAPDGTLRVQVADDGTGIAPQDLPRVFEYGFTTRPGGTGIGLHASAVIAKSMGGSLTGSSDGPGKGAVFTLELPLRAADLVA